MLRGLAAAFGLTTYFVLWSKKNSGVPPVAVASGGMVIGATVLLVRGVVGALPMHATYGTVDVAGGQAQWWCQ